MEAIAAFLKKLSGPTGDVLPALESIESFCENDTCEPVEEEATLVPEDAAMEGDELKTASEGRRFAVGTGSSKTMQRNELQAMIRGLREQGFSYEKIARHLEETQVPTISGRGKWRGQAVSKLIQ